jgi:hypothetical protein
LVAEQAQGLGSGKTCNKIIQFFFSIPFSGFPEAPVREATPLTTLPKAAQGTEEIYKIFFSVSDSDAIKTSISDKNPKPGENVPSSLLSSSYF